MRIPSVGPARTSSTKRRRRVGSPSGETFSPLSVREVAAPPVANASAPAVPISAVLALQDVADSTSRGADNMIRGKKILEHLDKIRLGLLSGGIPRQTLQRLAAELNAARAETADPRLRAILDEIKLRARVEIAKYDSGT
ncbi:MAG: flagellar assembly protein FliX [Alphaproteobacteria bacterium]|nr:flagellar assembly protein FliX [Alphaproteobacteria bacterium]